MGAPIWWPERDRLERVHASIDYLRPPGRSGFRPRARRRAAATCTAEDFAAAVDKSGAQLRAFNAEALPKLQDKLKQLKEKKGWDEEKALDSVRDDRTTKLDAEAEDLIVKIDMLGRPPEKGAARLQQARRARSRRASSCWR